MFKSVEPFYAVELTARARKLREEGRSIIEMQFGQPSTGAPPKALARAKQIIESDPMGYLHLRALKLRIVKHYKDTYSVDISVEQVHLTCGASPALVATLAQAFNPGDRIAFVRPGYVAYRNTVKALSLEPVEVQADESHRFQLSVDLLKSIEPSPNGVIVASPANPTGTIIGESDLKAIADYCTEQKIKIISDEIYHSLSYSGRTASMLEYTPNAYIVNSFSKYYSMVGWRLGWLVSPKAESGSVDAHVVNMFLTSPSMSQHAGLIAMDETEVLDKHLATYARNRQRLLESLPQLGLPKFAPPDGAFYFYVDVSDITTDSFNFCRRVLEDTGVVIAPGIDFDPIDGHKFIRISFAVSEDLVEDALKRLTKYFNSNFRDSD